MGISRIEMQGQVLRTQDFTTVKHQEDSRGSVQQANVQVQIQKQNNVRLTRVTSGERSENHHMNQHDAKEEGKNAYEGDGGSRRREAREDDGKVILKGIHKRKVTEEE